MNKALRITAAGLGVSAGIAGLEHGTFEFLQGEKSPEGLIIASIGPPCDPELIWNRCEPALTIIPNFAITGILAMILGLIMIVWSLFFVQRRYGGWVQILLSIALLLFGGGLFPPLIGMVSGVAGTRTNKSLNWSRTHFSGGFSRGLAMLYPWALIAYLAFVLGQWIVGYFFNEWLMANMWINVGLILVFLFLSLLSAAAHDIHGTRAFASTVSVRGQKDGAGSL